MSTFDRKGRSDIVIGADRDTLHASGIARLRELHDETVAALRAGPDVIYQGAFFEGRWQGFADFLLRVEVPSDLGPFSYELADTKLARHAKAAALLSDVRVLSATGGGPGSSARADPLRPRDAGGRAARD